ncbi:MAG: ATP-binding protein [Oscillospiraceae bacterium]|nr:ATP-binding protein [Oscillospiraceae bacterium]
MIKSLLKKNRTIVIIMAAVMIALVFLHLTLYYFVRGVIEQNMMNSVKGTAVATAHVIENHIEKYLEFMETRDITSEYYIRMNKYFADIKEAGELAYVYTSRLLPDGSHEFILDGEVIGSEDWSVPGDPDTWDAGKEVIYAGASVYSAGLIYDEDWGQLIVAYAPILNADGEIISVLGVDISGEYFDTYLNQMQYILLFVYLIFLLITWAMARTFSRRMAQAQERLTVMLDTSPLCAQIWTRDLKTIDCNEAAVRLYGFKDKSEYLRRFLEECSAAIQPDGQRADEKAAALVHQAFEDGYCRFEWMHRIPDEDLLFPAEVTLVRATYKDHDVVIGYTRDLREHYKMMEAIKYRDSLMMAVNKSAVLLLDYDVDYFENALYRSMVTIAEAVKVDCLYIWKNQVADGKLCCSQLYEWSKDETVYTQSKKVYSYDETFPGWEEKLANGEYINGPVSLMSEEVRRFLAPAGILSILVVPIFIKDEFWGFVGFDDNREERTFIEEEVSILNSASLLVASSFIHNDMIHGIRETSEQLQKQDNLMKAVNKASTLLLVTHDDENIESLVTASLELIGLSMETDRIYIWKSSTEDDNLYHEVLFSWNSDVAKEKIPVPIGTRTSFELSGGLDWDDYFLRGDCINGTLSTFSEKEQTFVSMFGLKSVAVIPMFLDNQLWGVLCVGDCEDERVYTDEEIAILRSVTLMMASTINRHALVERRTRALAEQTVTLYTLFDSLPDMIFTKDADLKFTQCNKAFLENFGKSLKDVIGRNDAEAIGVPADLMEYYATKERKVLSKGKSVTVEEPLPLADGTLPLYETTIIPLILEEETIGIVGIGRDITERKKMEQLLTDNYEYAGNLQSTLSSITESRAISGGNLKTAAELITKKSAGVLGVNFVGIWRILENGNALESITYYNAALGEHSVQPFYDLTLERRQKYKNLLETERLITMSNLEDCKLVFDGFGVYEPTNMCAALDAPIRVDGKIIGVVCIEQEKCDEYPDGREWLIEEQNFAASLADLMALAISGHERRKARDAAEIANQSKSAFIANISHEIRTPMNVIMGLTELMMDEDDIPDSAKDYLEKIHVSGSTLTSIINDILDISKMESGKFTLTPVDYQLASMLNDIATFNVIRIDEKPITFSLEIDNSLFAYLHGDDLRVRQILNNLLSNAFKYTKKGAVTLRVSCERENETDIKLMISVSDTGMGIRKEDAEKLFKDYHQVDMQANRKIEGTGLGLSITKKLTELMDGEISVESVHGLGSIFRVVIRQKYVSEELVSAETIENLREFRYEDKKTKTAGAISRPDLSYARVLVVDDFPTNLDVAKGMLGKYKMKVDTVMSGQEAINVIKAADPVYDAVFMDHMMPGMDGIEATERIKALESDYAQNVPVIALTANAAVGNEEMFISKGFQAFLSKPINVTKLDAVIRKWIMKGDDVGNDTPFAQSAGVPQDVVSVPQNGVPGATRPTDKPTDSIPGINMTLGLSLYEDDMEMYTDIMKSYAENIPGELEKLHGVAEETLRDYAIDIHTIKGAFAGIGAKDLSLRAKDMEMMAKDGDLAGVQAVNEEFIKDAKVLVEAMNVWLADK